MEKIRTFQQHELNKIRKNPRDSGLEFERFGRSIDIKDYSDRELNEMLLGIYKDSHQLLVDGGYFIDVTQASKATCILKDISYSRRIKPGPIANIKLQSIRNFYIQDYFLETTEQFSNSYQHKITGYLKKIGGITLGKGKYSAFYSIPNDFKKFYNNHPIDLFYPIQHYINSMFFGDDFHISDFEVISHLSFINE